MEIEQYKNDIEAFLTHKGHKCAIETNALRTFDSNLYLGPETESQWNISPAPKQKSLNLKYDSFLF
jgi:hypothetical protein